MKVNISSMEVVDTDQLETEILFLERMLSKKRTELQAALLEYHIQESKPTLGRSK